MEFARVDDRTVHARPPQRGRPDLDHHLRRRRPPSNSASPAASPAPAPTTTSAAHRRNRHRCHHHGPRLDYDTLGRLTAANSPAGNLTYTWTDRGLLATATGYGGTATYTYDGDGNLTSASTPPARPPSATTTPAGSPASVDPLTATTATNTYDTAGRLATVSHGAGNSTRDLHLRQPRPGRHRHHAEPDATTADVRHLRLRPRRPVTTKTTAGVTGAGLNTYGYDGLGRLTSWLSPGGTTTTYGYDAASNRTTVTTPAGTRTSTFDERNRLTGTTGAASRPTATPGTPAASSPAPPADRPRATPTTRSNASPKPAAPPCHTVTYTYDSLDRPAQRNAANFGYNDLTNNPVRQPRRGRRGQTPARPARRPHSPPRPAPAPARSLLDDPLHGDMTATVNPTTGEPTATASYDPGATPPPPAPCRWVTRAAIPTRHRPRQRPRPLVRPRPPAPSPAATPGH